MMSPSRGTYWSADGDLRSCAATVVAAPVMASASIHPRSIIASLPSIRRPNSTTCWSRRALRSINDCELEAQGGDELALLVLDRVGTTQSLQRLLGVLVAERSRALVIGLRGVLILGTAAPLLREGAHPLKRAGMVLRRRLLEQRARGRRSSRHRCHWRASARAGIAPPHWFRPPWRAARAPAQDRPALRRRRR